MEYHTYYCGIFITIEKTHKTFSMRNYIITKISFLFIMILFIVEISINN